MATRVVIVTQDDPFYVPRFFEAFFESRPEDVTIESVVLLRPFDESTLDLARRMYRLFGLRDFLRLGLRYGYRRAVDALGRRAYSVERVAARYGVPTRERRTINDPEFCEQLADVDVLLSVAAPEIFDEEVLSTPTWGCLNVHTADLPNYRGMLPTFWALYHGDDEIGVTVHTMTEEIDSGEVLRQETFPVAPDDSLHDVIRRGKAVGGRLAAEALGDVATGTATLAPMTGEGSYHSFPSAEESRELRRRGRALL